MQKFVDTVKRVTSVIAVITGVVLALGAALQAFSSVMNKHYNPQQPLSYEDLSNNPKN